MQLPFEYDDNQQALLYFLIMLATTHTTNYKQHTTYNILLTIIQTVYGFPFSEFYQCRFWEADPARFE